MIFHNIIWPEDRIDHIARHGIVPAEVEELVASRALVLRAKSEGQNPVYHVLGQLRSGKYLLAVLIRFPDGNSLPVTARPMTLREKQRFVSWRHR